MFFLPASLKSDPMDMGRGIFPETQVTTLDFSAFFEFNAI